jgi:hypothetical protein
MEGPGCPFDRILASAEWDGADMEVPPSVLDRVRIGVDVTYAEYQCMFYSDN